MDACVPPTVVLDALRAAGFVDVKRTRMLGLCSEYSAVKAKEFDLQLHRRFLGLSFADSLSCAMYGWAFF
jgi:hypothetical protein